MIPGGGSQQRRDTIASQNYDMTAGRIMRQALICFILLAVTPMGTQAATPSGAFAVRGAGVIDCKTFLVERKKRSRDYLMMGGWIDGYLTGINEYAPHTYDVASFESTELYAQIIADYCRKHPTVSLFAVMNSIVRERWKNRILERTPSVALTLGGQHARLYQETIRRIQERLASKGFYNSKPTGAFNAETMSAIAAFQKTLHGYKATGFPDQATLYLLFSQ
jgi:Putative peptidoglycan binding domain